MEDGPCIQDDGPCRMRKPPSAAGSAPISSSDGTPIAGSDGPALSAAAAVVVAVATGSVRLLRTVGHRFPGVTTLVALLALPLLVLAAVRDGDEPNDPHRMHRHQNAKSSLNSGYARSSSHMGFAMAAAAPAMNMMMASGDGMDAMIEDSSEATPFADLSFTAVDDGNEPPPPPDGALGGGDPPFAAASEARVLIKHGSLALRVARAPTALEAASARARAIVDEAGGYVESLSRDAGVSNGDDSRAYRSPARVSLQARVPAERFDNTLETLKRELLREGLPPEVSMCAHAGARARHHIIISHSLYHVDVRARQGSRAPPHQLSLIQSAMSMCAPARARHHIMCLSFAPPDQ